MSASRPAARWLIVTAVVFLVAVGLGWWFYLKPQRGQPDDGLPGVPPLSSSPYLNTGPDATYVGSAACIRCHDAEHKSYLRTGMGRSTAEVDPANEPGDAVVDHALSGRRYKVERRGGQLWHRELML